MGWPLSGTTKEGSNNNDLAQLAGHRIGLCCRVVPSKHCVCLLQYAAPQQLVGGAGLRRATQRAATLVQPNLGLIQIKAKGKRLIENACHTVPIEIQTTIIAASILTQNMPEFLNLNSIRFTCRNFLLAVHELILVPSGPSTQQNTTWSRSNRVAC